MSPARPLDDTERDTEVGPGANPTAKCGGCGHTRSRHIDGAWCRVCPCPEFAASPHGLDDTERPMTDAEIEAERDAAMALQYSVPQDASEVAADRREEDGHDGQEGAREAKPVGESVQEAVMHVKVHQMHARERLVGERMSDEPQPQHPLVARLVASEARVGQLETALKEIVAAHDPQTGAQWGDDLEAEVLSIAAAALHKEQSEPAKPTYRQLTVPTGPTISSGPFREKLFGRRREIAEPPFAEFEGGPDT